MTNTDKQALRVKAEKATQGEWWIDSHGSAMVAFPSTTEVLVVFVTDSNAMGPAVRHEDTGNLSHWRNDNDASFIAAANPATVLALLDELEAKDKKIDAEICRANREHHRGFMMASGHLKEHENVHYADAAEMEIAALRQRIAELEARTLTVKLPPLNDDLNAILGRPNFTCSHLAELLRKTGQDIPRKSEREQAVVIHWFLGLYLEHGDKWEAVAKADIQAKAAGIALNTGE